jgi:hypothetical protein
MAVGTITLARASPAYPRPASSIQMFIEKGSEQSFNPTQCLSSKQFTVNPNQTCVLITNLEAPSVKINKNDEAPLKFSQSNKFRLCYSIEVKQPGMALIVEEKTPLTLLLNSGCINAAPYCVSTHQWFELYYQQCPNKREIVEKPAESPASKKKIPANE